jgi:hypothetical protein
MTTIPTPPRRWYQFSLRTMFVGMILISAAFGWWVHRSREWIKQRHEALANGWVSDDSKDDRPRAPSGLWLFGEHGVAVIAVYHNRDQIAFLAKCSEARQLFPEAHPSPIPMIDMLPDFVPIRALPATETPRTTLEP